MKRPKERDTTVKLTMIGTGTIRSRDSRACAAVMIENPESTILIDCGPGSWLRLCELSKEPAKIDHIFLTHFHPDHTIDLISILFSRFLSTSGETHPVHIWGAEGIIQFFQLLSEVHSEWLGNEIFCVKELKDPSYQISDITIKWLPAYHTRESVCYRFETENKIIAISGDSGYCQELIDISHNADIAIFECSYPDELAEEHHLTPARVSQIARNAGVKRLILTHLYPEALQSDIENQISRHFSGSWDIAQDGDLILP